MPSGWEAWRSAAVGLGLSLGTFACTVEDIETLEAEPELETEFRDLVIVAEPDVARIDAPLPSAPCSIKVIGQTSYDIETNYLPRTVWCENGGADIEALKAQAIAARSVVYYEHELDGSICDSQSCQHASCKGSAEATLADVPQEVFDAVNATSGMYLKYDDILTYAFYVAGSKTFHGDTCVGTEGGAPTEKWVTYNNGKDGTQVEQTKLGSVFQPSDHEYGQNRGCMSQWGARCLEESGADTLSILQFYYGKDIEVAQADGECVDGNADLGEGQDAECGDNICSAGENEDRCPEDCQPCTTIADDTDTVIEESSECFTRTGKDEFWRVEDDEGHGGSMLWTESTENEGYNIGTWKFNFDKAGEYRVEVYIEEGFGEEDRARYLMTHDGEETNLRLDQGRASGWVVLGDFEFEAGYKDQSLKLTDLSGTSGRTVVFDAVRITPSELVTGGGKYDDVDAGGGRGGDSRGCSVAGDAGPREGLLALGLLVLGLRRRRR